MARQRDPRRDQAFEIYKQHDGNISNRAIAEQIGSPEKTVGGWKSKDKWDSKLKGESNGVLQSNERSTPKKKRSTPNKGGAPKFNKNALNNRGGPPLGSRNAAGHGAPERNSNAVTHGLFRKFLPDDDDTIELMEAINERGPLEMLWDAIVIKHTNIIRSQQILFVEDKFDETRVLTKVKPGEFGDEEQWEYQHAWDKQASAMNAYSRAMSELRGLIKDYMTLSGEDDHRRLQLARIQQSMDVEQEKLKLAKEQFELEKAKIVGDTKGRAATMSPEKRREKIDALERKRRN
ncbi:phage terminase small subunit [Aneurinibacillus aneurinilyticus]|uniref:phage terminase small subunit n=1 Tax=Aneurinibacillus aneurinilyticus TaxID=1391 RepID=UPI0023FA3A71|nr:phage terminase small subunit [Aneurinibacillus aneurinilyticus]MCI1696478.1 phage terminase small subunit [Aneurinibacillus aneurinilyticus]